MLDNTLTCRHYSPTALQRWQQLYAKPPIVVYVQSARKLVVVCWTCLVDNIGYRRAACNMSVRVVKVGIKGLGCRR